MDPRIWSVFNLWATIWSYFIWGETALWGKIWSKSVNVFQKWTIASIRRTPINLSEKLALEEIQANPSLWKVIIENLWDPKRLGWQKMQYIKTLSNGEKIVIHYVAKITNWLIESVSDFKFK